MADFVLEAGIKVASGSIDDFIREVQGELNKKKISIPFTPDQYSVQAFSKRLGDELKKNGVEIRAKANASDVKTFIRELQGQLNKSAVLSIPFAPAQHSIQDFAKKLQEEINKSDVKVEVKVDAKQAKQVASGVDDAKKRVTELNSALKEYYQLSSKEIKLGSLGGEEYEAVAKRLEVLRSRLSELGVSTEELRTAFNNNSLKEYIQSLTGVELTSEQLDKITKTVTDGLIKEAHAMDQSAKSSRDKADADRAAKEAEEAARKAGQERLNTINKLTTSVKSYITAFLGFVTVTQLVRKVYDNVLQLDKAVVDLQIATGKTRDEAADLVKQYSALGQQLGVQTKDVAESAVAWLRQGNSIEDTNKLIVASTMLSKLGRIEVSEATKDLTSTMKGYGIEVNDVISIIDRLTAVDLKAATSAGDIATAMQKTAVTANQVGIPLERLIGMVATLSEVSQQSPETVGTGLKSMLARMVNIKAGHLEDPETGEALNNVESALRGVGIQLRDVNGQFRNTNDVLEEVASRWKSFTSLQQNAVAVSLGGTRQQENVRILMEYWDKVVSLTDVASNSAGTAEKKFEAYTEGIEARIESLKAAWQSLSDTALSSDFVKGAVDVLTKIVNLLDQISPKLLVIGGILTKIAAGALKTGMASALAEGATYLGGLQAGLTSIGTTFSSIIGGIIGLVSKLWAVIAPFAPYLAIAAAAIGAVTIAIKLAKKETVDWNKAFEESKADFEKRSAGIADNTEKIEDYNEKLDENKKRLNELNALKNDGVITGAQEQEITNIELQNKKYETQIGLLQKKNEELAKGLSISLQGEVDAYGKKDFDLFSHEDAVDSVTLKRTLGFLGFGDKAFDAVRQSFYDEEGMLVDDLVESYLSGFDEVKSGMAVSLQDILDMYEVYKSAFMLDEVGPEFEDYQVDIDYAVLFLESRIQEAINSYQTFLNDAIRIGDTALAESIRSQMRTLYNALGWDWSMVDGGSGKKTTSTTSKPTYNWRSNNAEIINEAELEARKQAEAIAGVRAAVFAEQQRAINISNGIFDFDTYDDAWYAEHFPDFEQQRDAVIKAYPALEEYFELWGRGAINGRELANEIDRITGSVKSATQPSNKDIFQAFKSVLDADWGADKNAAIEAFAELAEAYDGNDTEGLTALLKTANFSTDKNSVIDTMIRFLEQSDRSDAGELIEHIKELKDVVDAPAKKSNDDIWSQFEDAVASLDKASDLSAKTKAVQDIRRALIEMGDSTVADQIRVMVTHLEDGSISMESFKDQVFDLVKGTEWEKFVNFDWDNVTPPPTVKDAFSQLKEVFEADWSSDKDAAIDKLSEMATSLGVNSADIEVMKSMLQDANLATNKNSVIDMIIAFLQSSNIEHADELIQHLLELRDATPATKNRSELSGDFISAVGGFKENGSKYDKNVAGGQITAAARAMFGGNSEEYAAISDLVNKLVFGKIAVEEFHNAIAELTKGTVWENFIPQDWFKKAQDTSDLVEGLTSDLNSLMSQGSDAQRKNKFDEIVKSMSEIEDLDKDVQGALKAAMESYLENQDEDAFKAEIARIFGGDEALRQYILDSWLPDVKTVKTEDAVNGIISDINSMQKEDTPQGRDEYYKKISDALALLGITAENTAGTGLFEFLQALQAGTLDGEEFERQLYAIAEALTKLLQAAGIDIDLTRFLPDQEQPESLQSRLATAMGTPQQIMPQYSDTFNSAKDSLMGLGTGDMITSEEQAVILQQLPQLSDEFREYAAVVADSTATDIEKRIALENLKTAFMGLYGMDMADEFRSSMEDLVDGMEDLDEGSLAYAEGIESIADAYGIATDTARDYFDELQAAVDGSTDAWAEFQKAATEDIFANVELQGEFNTDDLLAGLYTVQDVINATGWTSDELQQKLIANGLFEEVPNTITGKLKIPEFTVPGTGLHFPGLDVDASYDQPLLKPTEAFQGTAPKKHGGGGGKKKSPKTGGKTSILSEQYTNDKGLYDTLIDNLKNLNNLYEEGSEEWLRNQQRIIETYQAYAKTIQDEYDRLVKAGVDMTDKEMQTLAKDLLKVNKEMYDAAKEYWEAVRDNMKESMEHIVDQMDAVLDLRKAHKDLLTELRQENRELEKQYKIAQDEAAHPGLTEAEHELLFSSEDYKRLTGMLQDISKQADALYEDYKNKIASVTEDETYAISYITDEYERQLGLLESQYEIAKQQLAVEKARQELQNTLRERNTAVLINGAWTWMADPDAVQAAMENVADAEVELEDAITDSEFNKETAEIETARDAIKSSIDAMEALEFAIEDLAEGIVDLADSINENIFNAIGTTSRNYLKQTEGHGLELFMDELTELQETSGLVFSNTDVEKLYSLLSSGNTINSSNIFDDSIVHDSAAIASILSNTTNNATNGGNVIYINGIQLSDADSEMLLNALERVSYTWQA